jgi:flagellar L-ring protein precursor FlgH
MKERVGWLGILTALVAAAEEPSPLERYLASAEAQAASMRPAGPGSLYAAEGMLADVARDPRALQVNDLVTILVAEQATALSRGATSTSRQSSSNASAGSFYGATSSRFGNLLAGSSNMQLDGEGETSRQTTITTRLSARVAQVLPNGYLVLEGNREIVVNAERQLVTIRGVVRPADLLPDNSVRSDRLAQMEIRIDGKGVVNDAIRRPNFLYRLLLGILPF